MALLLEAESLMRPLDIGRPRASEGLFVRPPPFARAAWKCLASTPAAARSVQVIFGLCGIDLLTVLPYHLESVRTAIFFPRIKRGRAFSAPATEPQKRPRCLPSKEGIRPVGGKTHLSLLSCSSELVHSSFCVPASYGAGSARSSAFNIVAPSLLLSDLPQHEINFLQLADLRTWIATIEVLQDVSSLLRVK